MEDTNQTPIQILHSPPIVAKFPEVTPVQAEGQGVDREIPTGDILLNSPRLYAGQGPGLSVAFPPRSDQVQEGCRASFHLALWVPFGSLETRVHDEPTPVFVLQGRSESNRIPFHNQVKILTLPAKEQITYETTYEVDRHIHRTRLRGDPLQQGQARGTERFLEALKTEGLFLRPCKAG
jgi:hypothetical protein